MRWPGSYTGLTAMQAELLSLLRREQASGNTPSVQEMCDMLGLASKSGAHRLLMGLEERGYIERQANRARAIRVNSIASPPTPIATESELRRVPLAAILRELSRRGLHVSTAGHASR